MPPLMQLATFRAYDITGDTNHADVTRFAGFAIRESDGTPAVGAVNFRLGSVSGQIVWPVELAANESAGIFFGGMIASPDGVYVEVVSGTISGVLFQLV